MVSYSSSLIGHGVCIDSKSPASSITTGQPPRTSKVWSRPLSSISLIIFFTLFFFCYNIMRKFRFQVQVFSGQGAMLFFPHLSYIRVKGKEAVKKEIVSVKDLQIKKYIILNMHNTTKTCCISLQ